MKSFKILPVILFLIVFLSAAFPVFAGDYATLNFIGFSKDGKYLAFEEYGIQDGSGFPYANIYFVDTVKNSYAAPAVKVRLDNEARTEAQARARAKVNAAANLRKFRIVAGNTGSLVVSRLLTDLGAADAPFKSAVGQTQSLNFTDYRNSNYFENEYNLTLAPSEVKDKQCASYTEQPVYKFDLTLKDVRKKTTKILQKDFALPSARNCPLDYSMQNVYVYENKIAVFLNVFSLGFEGPDMRFLVVAGIYK